MQWSDVLKPPSTRQLRQFAAIAVVLLAVWAGRAWHARVAGGSALVPLAIILFVSRSRVKTTVTRVVLGLGIFVVLAVVSATRVSERLDLQTIVFYFLSEGLYAGHSLPGIINRLVAQQ